MKWLVNTRLGAKLISAFVLMAAVVAFVGIRGMNNVKRVDDTMEAMYSNQLIPIYDIGIIRQASNHYRLVQYELVHTVDQPREYSGFIEKQKEDMASIDEMMSAYAKSQITEEEKRLIGDYDSSHAKFESINERLLRTLEDPNLDVEGRKAAAVALLLDTDTRTTAHDIDLALENLQSLQIKSSQALKDNADRESGTQRRIFTSIIVACTVFAVLIGILLSRMITAPLGTCVASLEDLAKGRLVLPNLDTERKDEIGRLSRAMVRTIDSLRKMIAEIKQSSTQVATSADQISVSAVQIAKGAETQSSSTDETSSTMVEMASQIDNVAKSAQNLATNVDETSSSIQEMASSVEQVAKNAEVLLTSVDETGSTIEQMTTSLKTVADRVKVVDNASREAAKMAGEGGAELSRVINGIGSSSKDIGKIVKIIEEIADQTNLLALNAAIEAARAGEAGKGFAVVAEEVKRLAERSMNSTREISNFVETVQKDVNQAVDLTGNVLKRIVESVDKSTNMVGEVYSSTQEQSTGAAQIVKVTTNMQNVTREMATAARQQATGAREIMKAVEIMNRMTQQVADATSEQKRGGNMVVKAIEQIAQVSQQNLSATEELSRTTAGLAKEAERLQKLADQFVL